MDNFCLLSIRLKINTHTFTSHFGEVEHEQVCGVSCQGKAFFPPQITQYRSTVWCNGANMCSHPLKTDSESFFPLLHNSHCYVPDKFPHIYCNTHSTQNFIPMTLDASENGH